MLTYLEPFIPLVDAIAKTFGKNCEVVLHDFSEPHKSIIKIANSHMTGRTIGDPATDLILSHIAKNPQNDYLIGYRTKTKSGAELRSSTIFIRNKKKKIIGALCINIDITPYRIAMNFFEELCATSLESIESNENEYPEKFESDVDNLLNELLEKSIDMIGKPIVHMKREDKLRIISDLKDRGHFLIKGSAKITAEKLNVSISTIYKYLEELR